MKQFERLFQRQLPHADPEYGTAQTEKHLPFFQNRRSKLFYKLLMALLLISIVPLIVLCGVLNVKMERVIRDELKRSYQQMVSQHMLNLNHKLETYQRLAALISANSKVMNAAGYQATEAASSSYLLGKEASEEIGKIYSSYNVPEGRNITVYCFNETPVYGQRFSSSNNVVHQSWYSLAVGRQNSSFYTKALRDSAATLSFTARINDSRMDNFGRHLGFVKLDVSAFSFFESSVGPFSQERTDECFLLDEKGHTLLASTAGRKLKLSEPGALNTLLESKGSLLTSIDGEQVVVFAQRLSAAGLSVAFVYRYGEAQKRVQDVTRVVTVATVISILAATILAVFFSRSFSNRLSSLVKRMERVGVGNMSVSETVRGNDEIAELEDRFNCMVRQVNQLIQSNYIQELEHKEAELKTLQLQITPHFLYNTLETLNSIGAINHCPEVCEISQRLGDMLRYSINTDSTEFVPLSRELQHIDNYIYIQKLRFQEMFEFFVNVDENLQKVPVLRFILQPVVENAILHGFRDANRKGCIELSAWREGDLLLLSVSDDGQGIEPEQVEALNDYLNQEAVDEQMKYHKSIGIRNVNMRIKLTCGKNYGIRIQSRKDEGTDVIYTLPIH